MSEAMKKLQERCGVTADGAFGPNTARAIAKHYDLSPNRAAHLLGQASHESAGFTITKENLYYSTPERLCKVWPSRFKTVEDAMPYAKNPKALADKVYSNRMGNGPAETGEAAKFIGRGLKQLTGKDNYARCGNSLGLDLVGNPDLLLEPLAAARSAGWFWKANALSTFADAGDIKGMTKKINGGYIGLEQRQKLYDKCLAAINT